MALCSICKKNEVESTKAGVDFCRICFYTGVAAERDLASLLDAIRALDEVKDAAVWHTGGGCFNLAVTLTDGRLLTPSEGVLCEDGKISVDSGLPGWGDYEGGDDEPRLWGVVVSESVEVWNEWDEDRLYIPQTLWTTDDLVEGIAKIARGEIVRPVGTTDPFEVVVEDEPTGGVRGQGYVGAGLDEKPEAYIVAVVEQGRIVEVLARYEVDAPNAAPDAIWKRDDVRREDEFARRERTVLSLAVRHDCDENAVPYVSDGALGHGFECGVCGAFLQAG